MIRKEENPREMSPYLKAKEKTPVVCRTARMKEVCMTNRGTKVQQRRQQQQSKQKGGKSIPLTPTLTPFNTARAGEKDKALCKIPQQPAATQANNATGTKSDCMQKRLHQTNPANMLWLLAQSDLSCTVITCCVLATSAVPLSFS